MKKVILSAVLVIAATFAKAQMVSVAGGSLWQHGHQKGFVEAEVMQGINEKVALHLSGTAVLGGKDMGMVGVRYALDKKILGATFSACFMEDHKPLALLGVDIAVKNDMRIVYNHATNGDLITVGLKVPVYALSNKSH